jgi:hypothetical protein
MRWMVSPRPIISTHQLEAALQVPYLTAQRYVEKLIEMGLLREITGQARNRLYCADEVLHPSTHRWTSRVFYCINLASMPS